MILDFIFLQVYRAIHLFVFILLQILYPVLNSKIKSILQEKNGSLFKKQASQNHSGISTIWIHAASGEFEYAKSVIRDYKQKYPNTKILVTYFSTSYKKSIENFPGVDFCEILPWDFSWSLQNLIHRYQPQAVLIARTDVWPEMIHQIRRAKLPCLLFSATLGPKSARHRWPFSRFIQWNLNQISKIFVVAQKDQELFQKTQTQTSILVQGDTRYDQVIFRLNQNTHLKQELLGHDVVKPIFIFGSTWPEDEKVILPTLPHLIQKFRIIIAPHELSHLAGLENVLKDLSLESVRYSQSNIWDPNKVLIIDQFGILASLYTWSDFTFVGGSFKKQVHSVMEPLAAGNICWVGPYHENNREAVEFQSTQHVRVIESGKTFLESISQIDLNKISDNKDELKKLVLKKQGATAQVTHWIEQNIR